MNLILSKILLDKDLNAWSKLKYQYFEPPYTAIYQQIAKFYEKHSKLPSFEELEVVIRDDNTLSLVQALSEVEVPEDLDTDILLQALVNEYAQKEVLENVDKMVDDIVFMDAAEMVERLSTLAIELEEKTESSEQIVLMSDFMTVDAEDLKSFTPLGISNDFDAFSMGMAPTEFLMFGGYRGSGKSVVCANIVANQFLQGNSSLYFTIEMRGKEIYQREMSILSGVSNTKIRKQTIDDNDKEKLARTRSSMFIDGEETLSQYLEHRDFDLFERELMKKPLLPDNQIVIVDNKALNLANLDATIQTYKNKFKDKLKMVVVDYINVIQIKDPYKWESQMELAKRLKDIARKYEIVMVSPYQIDEKGQTRLAKGILDAPDWAFNLKAHQDSIEFENVKTRGMSHMSFQSPMEWDSLKIVPNRNLLEEMQEEDFDVEPEAPKSLPWGDDDL